MTRPPALRKTGDGSSCVILGRTPHSEKLSTIWIGRAGSLTRVSASVDGSTVAGSTSPPVAPTYFTSGA